MDFVGHVGQMKNVYRILVGNSEGREHLEDLGIDWKMILKCILMK
jgi:hypothetical protein